MCCQVTPHCFLHVQTLGCCGELWQEDGGIGDVEVKPAFTPNGHYVLNIFDELEDVMNFEDLNSKEVDHETFVDSIITDEVSDFDPDLEVELDEEQADEFVVVTTSKCQQHERKLKFWEVYVGEGSWSKFMQRAYDDDVEVRQFSLPNWSFENAEQKAAFRQNVVCGPPCRT